MRHIGTQIINTQRLVLRPFTIADTRPAFNTLFSDERVWEHMRIAAATQLTEMRERMKNIVDGYKSPQQYHWAVTLAETGELAGSFAVHENEAGQWEIGYCYAVKHWDKGYATEAIYAVCEYMFTHVGITQIACGHSVHNPASRRVIEKAGFKYKKDYVIEKTNGTSVPGKFYILKKEDF